MVITIRGDPPGGSGMDQRLSRWFYRCMSWFSDTEIRPAAADFRLMSRPAVDALLRMGETHRFLRGMVQWLGFPSSEVHYLPAQRGAGQSKYSFRRKLRLAVDGVLSFSKTPLRLPLLAGLLALTAGPLATLVCWLCGGGFWPGVLIGSMSLLGGGILCALGICGEYLGRIYDQVRARPLFVLKEQSDVVRAASHGTDGALQVLTPSDGMDVRRHAA